MDPGEEVAPVLQVWMRSSRSVCKLLSLRYLMRFKNKRGCMSLIEYQYNTHSNAIQDSGSTVGNKAF